MKEYFTIYKLPAVSSDTYINIYALSQRSLQTAKSSKVNQREKKAIVMAKGKDVNFSKANQLIKMSVNFSTRE